MAARRVAPVILVLREVMIVRIDNYQNFCQKATPQYLEARYARLLTVIIDLFLPENDRMSYVYSSASTVLPRQDKTRYFSMLLL